MAVSTEKIRWPNIRDVPGELRRAALIRGNVPRRLSRLSTFSGRLGHTGATGEHRYPCHGRGFILAAASSTGSSSEIGQGHPNAQLATCNPELATAPAGRSNCGWEIRGCAITGGEAGWRNYFGRFDAGVSRPGHW